MAGGTVTRFAPSPTGPLHLGHAYAALVAQARAGDGTFLLRIEDIDRDRSKIQYETNAYEDLRWLGLNWPEPVMRQSSRMSIYAQYLDLLEKIGVTYRCTCSRGDIKAALSAPQEGAALIGPDGPVYPGICRKARHTDPEAAIRLDMARAMALTGPVRFEETGPEHFGHHIKTADELIENTGDIVLSRKGVGIAYHLAVVVDDAAQGITEVTRGSDLFEATAIHVVLQRLLGLPTPHYHHHRLIRDGHGKRLAKRDDARALAKYRAEGASPEDIRHMIGL